MDEYRLENITKDTIVLFKDCFGRNGSCKKEEKIFWQFLATPVKQQFVNIAIDKSSNKTAAIYAIFPVKFFIAGQVKVGSQSLDTMTDKDFRGRGLFINLAKDIYQKAIDDDVKLVYGFPNGNSNHGFEKKLSWKNLDPVPFLIKPLKTRYFTKKIKFLSKLPNLNLRSVRKNVYSDSYKVELNNEFPIEVNKIWSIFSKHFKIAVNRDKEYLEWRYLKKPLENYKIAHVYSKANDEYLGFVVYTVKEKHGGSIGYIMELLYDTKKTGVGDFLLQFSVNEINKEGADCILSWCLEHSPNYNSFKKFSFLKMPKKLRPIELHFGVRSFDDKFINIINERENWYLSYSDSDTV